LRGFKTTVRLENEAFLGVNQSFETLQDLRRVDEYMNSMTPVAGAGRRTSVEMYEVVLDSDEL
jgi:hypothetical protein